MYPCFFPTIRPLTAVNRQPAAGAAAANEGDAQPSLPLLSYREHRGPSLREAHAASSGADEASECSLPHRSPSGEDHSTSFTVVASPPARSDSCDIVLYLFGEMFGLARNGSSDPHQVAVALVFALAMIPLYPATRRNFMASARGDESGTTTPARPGGGRRL